MFHTRRKLHQLFLVCEAIGGAVTLGAELFGAFQIGSEGLDAGSAEAGEGGVILGFVFERGEEGVVI